MPPALSQDPRPAERQDGEEPSWADKVADILRRIFVPGERTPQPVLVPVYPRPYPRPRRRS
jgi:hypothetical protein